MHKRRRWIVSVLAVCFIAANIFVGRVQSPWRVRLDFTNWRVYAAEMHHEMRKGAHIEREITAIYYCGPVIIWTTRHEITGVPIPRMLLGTNAVQVGMVIYNRSSQQEIGRVIAVERYHEFDDGTVREGALVRSTTGVETWTPREVMSKAFVER
jgi:hypothetical protein